MLAMTALLLTLLQDDDVKAFPHMRFNPRQLVAEDASVARFIRFIESLTISDWSRSEPSATALDAFVLPQYPHAPTGARV